jgi:N-acetylneuraminate synthase
VGRVQYGAGEQEAHSQVFRRSLFVVEDVTCGERFTVANVRSIRPGTGLPPKFMDEIIGRRAARDISRGTPLDWSLIAQT